RGGGTELDRRGAEPAVACVPAAAGDLVAARRARQRATGPQLAYRIRRQSRDLVGRVAAAVGAADAGLARLEAALVRVGLAFGLAVDRGQYLAARMKIVCEVPAALADDGAVRVRRARHHRVVAE